VFRPQAIRDLPIFKVPELVLTKVFVNDAFKQRVERAALKGLDFQLLWESG
jgi:hypothetical protein